jgi:hypothetical protein
MSGDVEVGDPARSHFHDHEHVQQLKTGGHDDQEIAGKNALGMVANKGHPTLRRGSMMRSCVLRQIASDGPRRDPDSQFQKQFSCNTLLTPGRVLISHRRDQFAELDGDSGPSARLRFPLPQQPKAAPMPPDQGLRLNDGQSPSPGKEPGKQYQSQASGIRRVARPDLALQVQRQLFAQEKVLGGKSPIGLQTEPDEPEGIQLQIESGQQQMGQGIEFGHHRQDRTLASS